MEFKGTKGEWKLTSNRLDVKCDNKLIAETGLTAKILEEEALANAKLISAAPELLEALQFLWKEYKENSGLDGSDLNFINESYGIEKAIKKALGQ